jgi:hypothetical protein
MSSFSKLLGGLSNIENKLENLYTSMIQTMTGMSSSEAKKICRELIQMVKEESIMEGTSKLPQDYGDQLLKSESTDEKVKSLLIKKRSEGVRDEDIRWFWNMNDLERRMMFKFDEWSQFAHFLELKKKGLSEEKILKELKKSHPFYGDTDDTSRTSGDDRPLPREIKDRVNIYIQKRSHTDLKNFKKDIIRSSRFNSLIRKELKQGNL